MECFMLKRLNVTLQTKIIILISLLLLFVIAIFTSLFIYYEIINERKEFETLALQTSKSISLLPKVKNPKNISEESLGEIQAIIHQVKSQVEPDFILIEYKNGITFTYPEIDFQHDVYSEDNYKAIVFGGEYTIETDTTEGKIIWAKAPIKSEEYQKVIGVVSVGFFINTINDFIFPTLREIFFIGIIVLTVGIYAGYLLSKNIRKQILGLEPDEIASLYTIRETILKSIKEGIISIDQNGIITLINKSAKEMLGVTAFQCINKPVQEILPDFEMVNILNSDTKEKDEEIVLNNRIFIVSYTPIIEKGKKIGVIASFRDKTDLQKMAETITEIKNYSEELRAQTHEFKNKLHVISGLLQLEQYNQAVKFIQEETNQLNFHNEIIFNQIHDSKIQAILLGKIGKASEKKVKFVIDENSSLEKLPDYIEPTDIITIIGNLIDNAIEAVEQEKGIVTFFATDIGNDLIIEVSDNGKGFSDEQIPHIFQKGISTKEGKHRGYGLFNVKSAVDRLNGHIEIQKNKGNGTIFTVYIPKRSTSNNGVIE